MGESQWEWLEKEIKEFTGMYFVIGSSTLFVKDDVYVFNSEKMHVIIEEYVYLDTKLRIYELLAKYNKNGVFVISGDIHEATIGQDRCTNEILGYPIYDITSSSLTHSHEDLIEWISENLFDISALGIRIEVMLRGLFVKLNTYDIFEEENFTYSKNNFGIIEMCWDDSMENLKKQDNGFSRYSKLFDQENNHVSMNVFSKKGELVYNKKLAYTELVNKNYSKFTKKQ